MTSGYFDNDNNEYVVKKYDTERPWINYISNGRYCSLISQTGGGYSFWKDPKFNRITKYRYDNHPQDRPGKYLYIKDQASGEFWANGWQPTMKDPQEWECRHGLGYSTISSKNNNISSSVTYFVPEEDDVEVWIMTIKNDDTKPRPLKVTPYVEFSLFNAADEYSSYPNLRYFNDGRFSEKDNAILYYMHFHSWLDMGKIFMGLSEKITGYSIDRRYFLGNYRSEVNPLVIESGEDHNTPVYGSDCCGAPSFELTLAPNEEKTIVLTMGVDNNKEGQAKALIEKYSDIAYSQQSVKKVKESWLKLLSNYKVSCPDENINTMVNIWNQYQCKVTFDWSRWASYYHTGTSRGIGFRDTSQDSLGTLHILPELVKDKIHLLAKNMYEDGHAYHCFFPGEGTGDPTKYGDDHIWIVNAVYNYINETGDLSILDEEAPYIEGSSGTIFDHMMRALNYAFRESGPNGFPKMFFADWNDCLNNICLKEKGEQGETVMVAMQLYQFGNYVIEMAEWAGKSAEVNGLSDRLEALKKKINEVAWDGEWYIRAFTDEQRAIGSKDDKEGEGQIFLNAQSWAILSDVAENSRREQSMDSVYNRLNSEYGIKLLDPPYTSFPNDVGSIIHYPGGIKENAGIFCHANTWAIIAECKLKRADKAMQYYQQILPPVVSEKIGHERYRVEPYVYTQFITGPDHDKHGSASHSWLTGTSVWSFVSISQHILGVQPSLKGLNIDPCIPADWKEYAVNRFFRGATYNISFSNPNGVTHGVSSIKVNGEAIEGTVIPAQAEGTENKVEVVLG